MQKIFVLSMMMILVSGCGPGESTPDEGPTEAEKQQALRESEFGAMAEAMDQAREVEKLQQERKGKLDAAIEE